MTHTSRRRLIHMLTLFIVALSTSGLDAKQPSNTRKLRRLYLSLVQHEPTYDDYQALLKTPEGQQEAYLKAQLEALLESDEFQKTLRHWGHDYLKTGDYIPGERWTMGMAIQLARCDANSLHPNALRYSYTGGSNPCDDPNVAVKSVMPWWSPTQPVEVLGAIGDQFTSLTTQNNDQIDCANTNGNTLYNVIPVNTDCSCGPNLIYCARIDINDGDRYQRHGQRRSAFEEPARLFSHIVTNDAPFTDLILGNYTVVNQGLFHMYMREARHNAVGDPKRQVMREMLDMSTLYQEFADPGVWKKKKFSELNPYLIDDRAYTYDPTQTMDEPEGIPSSGVLTTLLAQRTYERERVRAARWMESLACKQFSPPDSSITFNVFEKDPAKEGACQHCHRVIDPAAIHFKRFYTSGQGKRGILGLGRYRMDKLVSYAGVRRRVQASFEPNTALTPITEEDRMRNLDAVLIDYLPTDQTMLGQVSDGTIGPLGFAKMLVASGEFDTCTVRKTYERFGGRMLVLGEDQALINDLKEVFLSNNRSMKTLIKHIVSAASFYEGH